jgi:hypothetical protein
MRRTVICEGPVDVAALTGLLEGRDVEIYPKRRSESGGRVEAIRVAATSAKTIGDSQIVLVLDRNGYRDEEIRTEVTQALGREWRSDAAEPAPFWHRHGERDVHLVLAGRPDSELLQGFGVARFAIDDYLLELCLDDSALRSFVAGEDKLSHRPTTAADLLGAVDDVRNALHARGIELKSAKRYLHLVAAIIGANYSPAKFAERIVRRCPEDVRARVFGALVSDILAESPLAK